MCVEGYVRYVGDKERALSSAYHQNISKLGDALIWPNKSMLVFILSLSSAYPLCYQDVNKRTLAVKR